MTKSKVLTIKIDELALAKLKAKAARYNLKPSALARECILCLLRQDKCFVNKKLKAEML